MPRKRLLILVSGLAASGKSTLAKRLSTALKVNYYSGGDALRRLAVKQGYRPVGKKWWDTEEGMKFLSIRQQDPFFDRKVDEELKRIAEQESAVIDSWVLPWLLENGFKIWLKSSVEARAQRMRKRDKISIEEAVKIINERDKKNYDLYYSLYGIRLGEDLSPFHLVLDTSNLNSDAVFKIVLTAAKHYFKLK
ncbi:MAG: cytidylate kinase family protein [Nitrososphaerota archaeon]